MTFLYEVCYWYILHNYYCFFRLLPTREMAWMLTSGITLLEIAIVWVYVTALIWCEYYTRYHVQ